MNASNIDIETNCTTPTTIYTYDNDNSVHQLFLVLNGLIAPVLCLLGIMGNTLNLVIFMKMTRYRATAINCFLLAISVADALALVFYFLYGVLCLSSPPVPLLDLQDFTIDQAGGFVYFYYFIWHFPANVAVTVSTWCTVSVMVFRFIAVYYPLRASTWCSILRAKYVVCAVVLVSVVLYIPACFTIKVKTFPQYNMFLFIDTELSKSRMFYYVYLVGLIEVTNSVLPFVMCLVLAVLLIHALRINQDEVIEKSMVRHDLQRNMRRRNQRKISVMLIVVVVLFLVCTLPSLLWRSLKFFLADDSESRWKVLRSVADLFQITNQSLNFGVYLVTNKKFSQILRGMVLCYSKGKLDALFWSRSSKNSSRYLMRTASIAQNSESPSKPLVRKPPGDQLKLEETTFMSGVICAGE